MLLVNNIFSLLHRVLEFFNVNSMPVDVQKFMMDVVQTQIDHREKNNVSRKDFIQFLIQLRSTDPSQSDDLPSDVDATPEEDTLKTISIEQCAAQVFLFYVAGFDTSASTTAYTLFELARNHDIMHRVQAEIDTTLAKHSGVLSYECLQDMEYMELCILGEFISSQLCTCSRCIRFSPQKPSASIRRCRF